MHLESSVACLFLVVGNSSKTLNAVLGGPKNILRCHRSDILSYPPTALFCAQKRLNRICQHPSTETAGEPEPFVLFELPPKPAIFSTPLPGGGCRPSLLLTRG